MNAIAPASGLDRQEYDVRDLEKTIEAAVCSHDRPVRDVLLLDACMMTRECLARMLEGGCSDFRTWATPSAAEAPSRRPSLVLINIRSARIDDHEVVQLAADVRERFNGEPALAVISDRDDPALALQAVRHGYRGYIPTSLTSELAIAAVKLVLAGGTFVPNVLISWCAGLDEMPNSAESAVGSDSLATNGITDREHQVLDLLRQGKPNKIIAYELQISESTVKVHVRHIMRKLRATNRTQVAVLVQSPKSRVNGSAQSVPTAPLDA